MIERLTTFIFPVLSVALAALAWVWQGGPAVAPAGDPLFMQVWEQPASMGGIPAIDLVLQELASQPASYSADSHRSVHPFWFLVKLPVDLVGNTKVIDFPSRHAMDLSCWDPSSGVLWGQASLTSAQGQLQRSRAGFAWAVPDGAGAGAVLCRSSFRGAAQVSAQAWSRASLAEAQRSYQQTGLVIELVCGALAMFMLLVAVVNSSALYLALGGALLLHMRMAALLAGTDFQFFGFDIPPEWLIAMRQGTLCLYLVNSVGLFGLLFKEALRTVPARWPLTALQWLAVCVSLLAPWVTYEDWLPIFAGATGILLAGMMGYLAVVLRRTQSRVAAWSGVAWGASLLPLGVESVLAATGRYVEGPSFNSIAAVIAFALFVAVVVAGQLRSHRLQSQRAQRLLEAAYQDSPDGLFSVREGTQITQTNPAFQAMVHRLAVAKVAALEDLFEAGVVRQITALHQVGAGGNLELQARVQGADVGATQWFSVRASTVDGSVIECALQDITERVSANEYLEYLASHDPLTGCLNLRGLGQKTSHALHPPRALAYFDLDRFKLINDLYGHTIGDLVLQEVSERMRCVLEREDLLARIGGDEFIVVFYQGTMAECVAKCNSITTLIGSAPFQIENQSFALDVSGGLIGMEQSKNPELKDIVSAANTLCRMAKKRPDERLVVMQSSDRFFQQHQDEMDLINCLQRGETPEGLFLLMQPEVSLSQPFDSLNFEMLVRLRKPDGSIIPAGTIMEAAEAHGKAVIIDRWVVNTAIRWIEAHAQVLQHTYFVGVNLSGGSLNDERFTEELFALFALHPIALEKICLEVTETVAITDMRNMQRFIDRVRAMGGKVALDDFGAGYSSFGYLKGLSVDSLKLDGLLVRDAVHSPAGQAIIAAIAGLVRGLGMKSVGEFAEDLATIKVLFESGVDYAQGYGISKPVAAERILAARSAADLIEDPEILNFLRLIHAQSNESLSLFHDVRRNPLR